MTYENKLIRAYKEIINGVSGGSAGRCPFCGAYNFVDFRTSDENEFGISDIQMQYSKPHKRECIAVVAYEYLTECGITVHVAGEDGYDTVST